MENNVRLYVGYNRHTKEWTILELENKYRPDLRHIWLLNYFCMLDCRILNGRKCNMV